MKSPAMVTTIVLARKSCQSVMWNVTCSRPILAVVLLYLLLKPACLHSPIAGMIFRVYNLFIIRHLPQKMKANYLIIRYLNKIFKADFTKSFLSFCATLLACVNICLSPRSSNIAIEVFYNNNFNIKD